MQKIRVIFLDVDGVLNSWQSAIYFGRTTHDVYGHLCPISLSNFKYILEKLTDIQIVISSTWRKGTTRMNILKNSFESVEIDWNKVIGKTPVLSGKERGEEIQEWLNEHPEVEEFAIIDDDSDMAHLKDKLFQTNHSNGLDFITMQKILKHFGHNDDF